MVILGGWVFLMSEVPLYVAPPPPATMNEPGLCLSCLLRFCDFLGLESNMVRSTRTPDRCPPPPSCAGFSLSLLFITLKPRVE